ncbi:MAG: ABC transporter permease, partial [Acutalibacteraceae bacterium]
SIQSLERDSNNYYFIIRGDVNFSFYISGESILRTVIIFSVIFVLILLNTLRQIKTANPVALFHSENVGEKPPKANWLLGIVGIILLAAAYTIAVIIKEPLTAMTLFFAAVIMVIIATYLLFIFGSVVLCRALQKNKHYYYKPNHFVSVSSMVYRMKRNGAGLASICILATMVLVMISSSACLYFGAEDSLKSRYPTDFSVSINMEKEEELSNENVGELRAQIEQLTDAKKMQVKNISDYQYASVAGMMTNGVLEPDAASVSALDLLSYDSLKQVYFVPVDDYNAMTGKSETLEGNQVLVYPYRSNYELQTFAVRGGSTYQVKKVLDSFFVGGFAAMDISSSLFVVVPDIQQAVAENMKYLNYFGWIYSFDSDASQEMQIEHAKYLRDCLLDMGKENPDGISFTLESRAYERSDFYGTFGSLFYLGIMLSIVFVLAAVLIVYYKQISEGYEDKSRFEIMQKVGMTKTDIRKSVNSQMLTVFLLPLITAVIHLAFAFPIIRRLLLLFNMTNVNLFLMTTAVSVVVFAVFYTIVYRITSGVYYSIVSGDKDE